MPTGADCLEKGIRMCAEVYQHLKLLLREKGLSTAVGDEGGFAPDLSDSEEVLTLIVHAIEKQDINQERRSPLPLMQPPASFMMRKRVCTFSLGRAA